MARRRRDQESRLGHSHFEREKTFHRVSPLLFLTLGLKRRIGSCSSRFGRRTWDLEKEDRGLTLVSTIRVHSFPFIMFYLNFGMYQTSIMF